MVRLSEKSRVYWLFAIVVVACALGSLSQTAVNAMLGGINADFGTSDSVSQWLTTIYMLVLGITVPAVTYLSQKFELRTLLLATLVIYVGGSFIDAVAPSFIVLMIGRILQAIATGITLPVLQSIAMTKFPPGQNATAMGIAGIAMGFAPNIGPLVGGALVDTTGWRSFFVIFAAMIVVLIVATLLLVQPDKAGKRPAELDKVSLLLSTVGFGCLLLGFTNAASEGIAAPSVWIETLIGAVALTMFVKRQNNVATPLVSMEIFASHAYRISFIMQNCLFASFMGITLIIPLFVVNVCGGSALDAGAVFIPTTILALLVNPIAGILSDKVGVRVVVVVGSLFLAVGAFAVACADASTPLGVLAFLQAIRGIGVSALIGPLTSWGLSELPHTRMMDGSAFFVCVRQACASLGTAVMMLIITLVAVSADPSFAFHLAFGASALLACCVLVLALVGVRVQPKGTGNTD